MEHNINHTVISKSNNLEASEFYFETDFYLLKNNKDYKNLLKSLAVLEIQRCTVIQNLEKLAILKDNLLKNPSLMLKKIIKRENISKLKIVNIQELPNIDWSIYNTINENEQSKQVQLCDINLRNKNISDKQETQLVNTAEVEKPETFNKPWTIEEQLRLEELLVEYPPERNESNRYRKISEALGTRNLRQVCSRVQKYMKKMKKLGSLKSINADTNLNKKTVFLSHKNTGALLKPTTFIPSTTIINDVDIYNTNEKNCNLSKKNIEMSNETKLRILDEILKDKHSKDIPIIHNDIKCCVCQSFPIVGTRWNCNDCPIVGRNSDFCSDCMVDMVRNVIEEPPHPMDHLVIPLRSIQTANIDNINSLVDPNYVPLVFKTQNYLDPNFMV